MPAEACQVFCRAAHHSSESRPEETRLRGVTAEQSGEALSLACHAPDPTLHKGRQSECLQHTTACLHCKALRAVWTEALTVTPMLCRLNRMQRIRKGTRLTLISEPIVLKR